MQFFTFPNAINRYCVVKKNNSSSTPPRYHPLTVCLRLRPAVTPQHGPDSQGATQGNRKQVIKEN
jgi:hypothetical protein